MDKIRTYEDLIAWQKAHQLALAEYKATKNFPKEKLRFYNIAEASCEEAHYQLLLAHDLNYYSTESLRELSREVKRILGGLMQSIRS